MMSWDDVLHVLHEPRVPRQDWRAARGDKTQLRLAAARENIGTRRGRRGERGGATDAEELRRRRGAHMEGNERRGACDVLAPRGTLAD